MASKGIGVSVLADTKPFMSAVKSGVLAPLEDVQDELKEASKAGQLTGDKLEKSFKDAQQATVDYGDKIEETNRRINTSNRQQTSEMAHNSTEQKHIAKESIKEIGNEAKANAAETFSSFDGSAQSFVDGIQGTFGGLVSAFGPVGLAIASAGAIGIGLINGALQKADENSKQFKQDISDTASELIDLGKKAGPPLDSVASKLKQMAVETDGGKDNLKKLNDEAGAAKYSFKNLAQAVAGNTVGLKSNIDSLKAQREQTKAASDAQNALQGQVEGAAGKSKILNDQYNAQGNILGKLESSLTKAKEAQKEYDLYVKSGGKALQEAANDQKAYSDSVESSFDDVGAGTKKGIKSFKQFLDLNQKHLEEAAVKANLTANIYTKYGVEAGQALLDGLGPDVSSKVLKEAAHASPSAVQQFKDQYAKQGEIAGQQVTQGAHNYLGKQPPLTIKVGTKFAGISPSDLDNQRRQINAYYASHPITVGAIVTNKKTGQRLT